MAPIRYVLASLLGGVILLGAIYCLRWRQSPKRVSLIPTPRRVRPVPWSGMEVLFVLILYYCAQNLAGLLLYAIGLVQITKSQTELSEPELLALFAVNILTAPLVVAVSMYLMWRHSRTRPRHLGFSRWRWRSSLCLGYLTFLMMTPTVLGVSFLATYVLHRLGQEAVDHPLTKLAGPGASPIACTVMIVQAVFVAPFTEEFIFRGVMLPWLSRSWWGGWVAMVGAVVFTMLYAPGQWQPLAFALLICLLGFAYTFPQAGEQWVRRSIIGTALLFAMVHVNVWPSPMPLFVLGLALGWAAHRTRGLIAPIVLHSLFNAVSAIVLLFGLFD